MNGKRVTYYRVNDKVFTLAELAHAFGVKAHKTEVVPTRSGQKSARHVHAGLQRWQVPLAGLRKLETMREGFSLGTRRTALWSFASLLRKTRATESAILGECQAVAGRCKPPASQRDVKDAIDASRNVRGRISHAALLDSLNVTRHEQVQLTAWIKPRREPKAAKIETRRRLLSRELASSPSAGVKKLAGLLREKYSIHVTAMTVSRDLRATGQDRASRSAAAHERIRPTRVILAHIPEVEPRAAAMAAGGVA